MPKKGKVDISDLYPWLNQEQLDESRENLLRYLDLIIRIHATRRARHRPADPVAQPLKVN